jgi:hypothetical protein
MSCRSFRSRDEPLNSEEGENAMSVVMVRSKFKSESVAKVDAAAATMFEAIGAARPHGMHYASYKLADGVTYVAVLKLDEGVEKPLPQIEAFRQFQEGLKGWMAEPPIAEPVTVIGSYR